ncbi:MAG: universal stress protein [Rhodocyclaceae bacterium]|nr:universal stress protein [Rhodocyclaceae bacterium]MDP1957820.1 universal stress protein [Rhodocyclaceae bacterium]
MTFSRILLCVDGEPHTETAVHLALDLARAPGASLDALYVVDPYLKKFTDEIYAANRDECRAHLDRSLAAEGAVALDQLLARAAVADIVAGRLLEYGPPEEVIPRLVIAGGYDLVVLGGKRFSGRYDRWTSRDLPARLDGKFAVPVLLARV